MPMPSKGNKSFPSIKDCLGCTFLKPSYSPNAYLRCTKLKGIVYHKVKECPEWGDGPWLTIEQIREHLEDHPYKKDEWVERFKEEIKRGIK